MEKTAEAAGIWGKVKLLRGSGTVLGFIKDTYNIPKWRCLVVSWIFKSGVQRNLDYRYKFENQKA